jgi:glycine/D-amino acid oxidase-like deaminating enzyme
VLVVGSGISGALVAQMLTEAGLRVMVVDKRPPSSGSTAVSTALLQHEIDVPLHRLAAQIGLDRAQRIWRRSFLALDVLRTRVRRLGIEASIRRHDSLYLQGDLLDAAGLRREAAARRDAGFEVQSLGAAAVQRRYGITRRAALLGFGSLSADPRQLCAGFLRHALHGGAKLHSPVEISHIEPGSWRVLAATTQGPVIKARHVVLATGYEIARGVPRMGHTIASTWVIATRPQASWPTGCLIWEASSPYLYLRPGPDGRVLCGGEDEDFEDEAHRDALLPAKTEALQKRLQRLLPSLDARAEYAWCGSFGGSPTGAPSMGAVPGMPGCFAVLGYGGNGITFSACAAQIICAMITGGADADADLFSFHRRWPALRASAPARMP